MNQIMVGAENSSAPVDASGIIPIDMTGILQYEKYVGEIVGINSLNGPFYMQEFLKAKELSSAYHAKSVLEHERAKIRSTQKWAEAKLDRAPVHFKNAGIKPTDDDKKCFADMDREYILAKETEAYYKALSTFLFNKIMKFQSAHDDAKKIYDQTKEFRGSMSAVASGEDHG